MNDPSPKFGRHAIGDRLGRAYSHVGFDEGINQFLKECVIDQPALGLEDVAHIGLQQPRCLLQSLFEFIKESHTV